MSLLRNSPTLCFLSFPMISAIIMCVPCIYYSVFFSHVCALNSWTFIYSLSFIPHMYVIFTHFCNLYLFRVLLFAFMLFVSLHHPHYTYPLSSLIFCVYFVFPVCLFVCLFLVYTCVIIRVFVMQVISLSVLSLTTHLPCLHLISIISPFPTYFSGMYIIVHLSKPQWKLISSKNSHY